MPNQFNFNGVMSNAFKSVRPVQYLIVMPLIYAGITTLIYGVALFLMRDSFGDFLTGIEGLENADIDEDNPSEVFSAVFGLMRPFIPWIIGLSLVMWAVWSAFTAAGLRRYVRDESFRLGFGADELRIMGVSIPWYLLSIVVFGLPFLLIFGSVWGIMSETIVSGGTLSPAEEEALAMRIMGTIFGAFGLMLLLLPVYMFFATRLAPCFALTIKDRKFAFFDAWNVSRGRFWPILGGYVILALGGGMAIGVIDQIFQLILMVPMGMAMENIDNVESSADVSAIFLSPGFIIPIGIYMFLTVALRFALEHAAHGPAAYAARLDPRGSVDDVNMLQNFE